MLRIHTKYLTDLIVDDVCGNTTNPNILQFNITNKLKFRIIITCIHIIKVILLCLYTVEIKTIS